MTYRPDDQHDKSIELENKLNKLRNSYITPRNNGVSVSTAAFGLTSKTAAMPNMNGAWAMTPVLHNVGSFTTAGIFQNNVADGGGRYHISLSSASVLVTGTPASPIPLSYIDGIKTPGQIVVIKPVVGKSIILKASTTTDTSTGNLKLDGDITLDENHMAYLQFFNDIGTGGGKYVLLSTTGTFSGGGGGGFLSKAGDSMNGPIAYGPKVKNLSYPSGIGHLDISSATGAYTSSVLLGAVGSMNFYWIDGAAFDGQILKILIPSTITLHIHNGDGISTGNIFTAEGKNVDIRGLAFINLTFSNTQNGWILDTGEGNYFNTDILPALNLLNLGNDSSVWGIGNFSVLANVANVIFGTNASGTRWIRGQGAGGIVYNVLTGEAHSMQVNFVEYFNVRANNTNVTGFFTVTGQSSLNGTVFLGNNSSNNLNFAGSVNTDILPKTDNTFNLGSSSLRFIVNGERYLGFKKSAGTPSVTDLPDGYFTVMKDTRQALGVGVKLWYNDGNNLVSVTLS